MRLVKAMRAYAAPIVRLATRSCPVEGMLISDLKRLLRSRRIRPIMPLGKVSGYRFTRFGPGGKSPHQDIAALYLATGSRDEVRRYLVAHLEGFRPKSLAETLFNSNGPDLEPLNDLSPLTKLHPWDPVIQISTGYLGQGTGTFGPVSMENVEKECDRFTRSIDSIVRHGYRPEAYSRGFISGYMVFLGDDYRFVVRNGLHRLGALAALGVPEFAVSLTDHQPSAVDCNDVDDWVHVRSGFCSRQIALRLARRYFD